ncbi:MAG: hypothetical protein VW104_06445 [Halieaceae bacterium]
MISPAAILVFAALNNTPPAALTKADVDAVATAMSTAARSFEACMGTCFSQECTAYSPRTGACTQRGVYDYRCQPSSIGQCHTAAGCCLNATHSGAHHSAPAPDLRCAPHICFKNLNPGPVVVGQALVPLDVYTFNGTRVGVDVAALLAALDLGVAGELAMIRSYFRTYDNATQFLVSTGYQSARDNPTILPERYPRAHRLALLLAKLPPAMFEPNATLLDTPSKGTN